MRKSWLAIVFLLICLNLLSIIVLPISISSKVANSTPHGYVQIKVLEKNTLSPVSNATVCIVETREYLSTNSWGDTLKAQIPIIRNTNFDQILLRDWGEFTIIIYAEGYATHVAFYNPVYAGVTRLGLVCYLSPLTNSSSTQYTYTSNSPNTDYIKTLIAHFSPE